MSAFDILDENLGSLLRLYRVVDVIRFQNEQQEAVLCAGGRGGGLGGPASLEQTRKEELPSFVCRRDDRRRYLRPRARGKKTPCQRVYVLTA